MGLFAVVAAASVVAAGVLDLAVRTVPYRRWRRARIARCGHVLPRAVSAGLSRCCRCGARAPGRILAGQLLIAGGAPAVWWAAYTGGTAWSATGLWVLAVAGVFLALMDYETTLLPDPISLPMAAAVVALLGADLAVAGQWADLGRAFAAGGLLCAGYFTMALVRPGGMGLGDVKLAAPLGFALGWVSWGAVAVGGFAAFFLALIPSLVSKARGRTGVAFGPYMLAGALLGVAAGDWLFQAYLGLLLAA